jgi:hypothetical protein
MNVTVSAYLDGATRACGSVYKSYAFNCPTVFFLHLKRNLAIEISNTDAEKCWASLALPLQTVIAMPRTLPGRGTDNAGEVSCLDEAV